MCIKSDRLYSITFKHTNMLNSFGLNYFSMCITMLSPYFITQLVALVGTLKVAVPCTVKPLLIKNGDLNNLMKNHCLALFHQLNNLHLHF